MKPTPRCSCHNRPFSTATGLSRHLHAESRRTVVVNVALLASDAARARTLAEGERRSLRSWCARAIEAAIYAAGEKAR